MREAKSRLVGIFLQNLIKTFFIIYFLIFFPHSLKRSFSLFLLTRFFWTEVWSCLRLKSFSVVKNEKVIRNSNLREKSWNFFKCKIYIHETFSRCFFPFLCASFGLWCAPKPYSAPSIPPRMETRWINFKSREKSPFRIIQECFNYFYDDCCLSFCVWQRILKFQKKKIIWHIKIPKFTLLSIHHHSQCTEKFKYLYGKFHFIFPRVNKVDSGWSEWIGGVGRKNDDRLWTVVVTVGSQIVAWNANNTKEIVEDSAAAVTVAVSTNGVESSHWYLNSRANQQQVKSCLMCHMGERIRR